MSVKLSIKNCEVFLVSASKQSLQLSLFAAIIININIIIGSGIFINTTELAKRAGMLGSVSYAIVGVLLFPLILSFFTLLQMHPTGGFYSFSSTSLHPLVGFLSTWGYFTTKLSSATLVIHVFVVLMQKTFPHLASFNTLVLDIIVLSTILALNLFNVKTGSTIQSWLMGLKLFPLFFVIVTGMFFLQGSHGTTFDYIWSGIPSTIPLVLHAMLGFEAACSISRNIQDPHINAPRAVLFSYAIVMILYVLYQTMFYGVLGTSLAQQIDYRTAFPLLINAYPISEYVRFIISTIIHLALATSALSAGFGTIYTNMWNLCTLAELGHTFFPSILLKRNRFNIPFVCVLIQGLICISYLLIIKGDHVTFQQLSALGSTTTYTLSIAGLIATLYYRKKNIAIALLGLFSCTILLSASLYSMWWSHNSTPFCIFALLMCVGTVMFVSSKKNKTV